MLKIQQTEIQFCSTYLFEESTNAWQLLNKCLTDGRLRIKLQIIKNRQ